MADTPIVPTVAPPDLNLDRRPGEPFTDYLLRVLDYRDRCEPFTEWVRR